MTVSTPEQAIDRDHLLTNVSLYPGSHFVAMDEPLAHAAVIRAFFAGPR
ncbi:hypothetical protein [Micromonospora sp. NPDC048947]